MVFKAMGMDLIKDGWLAGWLVGWMDGWLDIKSNFMYYFKIKNKFLIGRYSTRKFSMDKKTIIS
jgi:hypothetical protein